jgi:sugar diacid utilization regulator
MTSAVLDEVPEFSAFTTDVARQVVLEHSLDHVHAIVRAIRSWVLPTATELVFVRERGALRASQQLPLSALLHSYRLGHRTVWVRLVHLLSGSDHVLEASLALTSLTISYTELISGALTEGYSERQRTLIHEVDHNRRDLLERILQGTFDRQSDTARLASEFALVSGADHLVVVLNAGPSASPQLSGEALTRAADTLKRHFVFAVAQPFVVLRHMEIVSIAPLSRARASTLAHLTRQALAELRQSGQVWYGGLSTVCAGLGEVGRGYQEARLAADMATASEGGACALLELRVSDYLMTRADETALRMIPPAARQVLQSAHADDRLLVETLLAHVRSDLSVAATAEVLAVHPNTVSYRLRKLSQRLDRDLSRFSDTTEVLAWITILEQLKART